MASHFLALLAAASMTTATAPQATRPVDALPVAGKAANGGQVVQMAAAKPFSTMGECTAAVKAKLNSIKGAKPAVTCAKNPQLGAFVAVINASWGSIMVSTLISAAISVGIAYAVVDSKGNVISRG